MGTRFENSDEIAERYRTTRHVIYHWVRERDMPHVKVGRKLLFPTDRCDQWLERLNAPPTTEQAASR